MGLGYEPHSGDEIWILHGGHVPFILRPYCTDSNRAGSYFLAGDCYIHGIMDGEAMEGWQESDARKIILA